MSRKEVPRAGLVKAALAGKITNQEGARALRLTVRQFKRLKARGRRQGLRGLVHRRRGQPSPRRLPAALRASASFSKSLALTVPAPCAFSRRGDARTRAPPAPGTAHLRCGLGDSGWTTA